MNEQKININYMQHIRVAVTGAVGQIGYAVLFRIASGQMFGANTMFSLYLVELPQAINSLQGVAMEIEDCAFPNLQDIVITDDINVGFKDVNWALLVGSVPRKAGMERNDLLTINGGIFCLLYTSEAADERSSVDLGCRRLIKKKKDVEKMGAVTE